MTGVHPKIKFPHLGVSKNRGGPPKSSILIGFSIINHLFWGTPIFGNTHFVQSNFNEHVAWKSLTGS